VLTPLSSTSKNFQPPALYKTEAVTAAYLGYQDIADFRRFRFSTPVLSAFNTLQQYVCDDEGKTRASRPSSSAYAMLQDATSDDKTNLSALRTSMQELLTKYASDPNHISLNDRDFILAGVIFHLSNTIDASANISEDSPLFQTDKIVIKAFESQHDISVPEFERGTIIAPVLGPIDKYKEHEMERYSRTFAALKNLQPPRRKT
jgi:hypothetical protein